MRNGHLFPAARPQQAEVTVAAPLNDAQLLALVAAQVSGCTSAEARVRMAADLVAEVVVNGVPRVVGRVGELRRKAGEPGES